MINLEWFRTFNAIFECKSITEASKILNMTQPGVSKHLSALEQHIGKKLFERTTRKLTATEYGKFLYSQINNPLKELEKIEYYSGKRAKKEKDAIIIGCTRDFYNSELKNIIYDFDLYIVTQFGTNSQLIEALENDKIQLSVGIPSHTKYDHQFAYITKQEFVLIASTSLNIPTEIEKDKTLTAKWLQQQDWFVYDNNLSDIKPFWELNFNNPPKLIPRYILPSYIAIIDALQYTNGIAIVPKHLCVHALENNQLHLPVESLKSSEQKLYNSYLTKNSALSEINTFIKKMDQS